MFLGLNSQGEPVCLPAEDLLTHGVILGRTGSGKTGLTIALLEEVAASGASAIVFDPKGDLTNLALSLTTPEEFEQWVERGIDPRKEYERTQRGLAVFGHDFNNVADWRRRVDIRIYAPGKISGGGRSINIFPPFAPPAAHNISRANVSRSVAAVLQALGMGGDPYDPAIIFLTEAILRSWQSNRALPIGQWPGVLTKPDASLSSFGGMSLSEFFPKRLRTKLARTVIGFQHQADRWMVGDRLDLSELTSGAKGKIAVFSLRHLSEDERLFFTSVVMERLVEFMFETSSSQHLKLLCVLDEARGYLPPHPYNPPTKQPISTILAQGRAQGIGMLIGTQNPMDLDYKALSNVGTWFVGRLRERDCARDLTTELRNRNVEVEDLNNLRQRQFLTLTKRGEHHDLGVRWCFNYLRGPLGAPDLLRLEGGTPVQPKVVGPSLVLRPKVQVVERPVPVAKLVRADSPAVEQPRGFFGIIRHCWQEFRTGLQEGWDKASD